MSEILFAIGWWALGLLSFPLVMFLRARRSDGWDNSNFGNMIRVLIHLALHPEDFGKMYYVRKVKTPDGEIEFYKRPFWYISDDELSDIVKSRPE